LAPLSLKHLDIEYPEVQASNLQKVVEYALEWFKGKVDKNVKIEDSGLFIDELKGYPGVYSSYAFKTVGCKGILKLMEGTRNRGAEFRACAGLLVKGKSTILYGTCSGRIAPELRGNGGFGFDPIFIPQAHERTFAEMTLEEKNELSHRARVMEKVEGFLDRTKGV
jgi:XTP/dITP diphosphohydrolase